MVVENKVYCFKISQSFIYLFDVPHKVLNQNIEMGRPSMLSLSNFIVLVYTQKKVLM